MTDENDLEQFEELCQRLTSSRNAEENVKQVENLIDRYFPMKKFMSKKEAAQFLCVSESTLFHLANRTSGERIPFYRVGGKVMFKRAEVENWRENQRQYV